MLERLQSYLLISTIISRPTMISWLSSPAVQTLLFIRFQASQISKLGWLNLNVGVFLVILW